jgi:hypothetical protein
MWWIKVESSQQLFLRKNMNRLVGNIEAENKYSCSKNGTNAPNTWNHMRKFWETKYYKHLVRKEKKKKKDQIA